MVRINSLATLEINSLTDSCIEGKMNKRMENGLEKAAQCDDLL